MRRARGDEDAGIDADAEEPQRQRRRAAGRAVAAAAAPAAAQPGRVAQQQQQQQQQPQQGADRAAGRRRAGPQAVAAAAASGSEADEDEELPGQQEFGAEVGSEDANAVGDDGEGAGEGEEEENAEEGQEAVDEEDVEEGHDEEQDESEDGEDEGGEDEEGDEGDYGYGGAVVFPGGEDWDFVMDAEDDFEDPARAHGSVPARQPGDRQITNNVWAREQPNQRHILYGAALANCPKLLSRILKMQQLPGELAWESELVLDNQEWQYIQDVFAAPRIQPLLQRGRRVLVTLPEDDGRRLRSSVPQRFSPVDSTGRPLSGPGSHGVGSPGTGGASNSAPLWTGTPAASYGLMV